MKYHFKSLDAFRGICALLVVLVHLSANGYFYDFLPIRHGDRSVPFFFVLSGFVICYAYRNRAQSLSALPDFILRRFGRIYPLHIFTLLLLVFLEGGKLWLVLGAGVDAGQSPFSGTNSINALFGNIFLLNGLGFYSDFTWNGPSWSISAEFYTYTLFFVVLVCSCRRLWAGLLLATIASGIILILAVNIGLRTIQGFGFAQCLFDFMLGACTFLIFSRAMAAGWKPWKHADLAAIALILAIFLFEIPFRAFLLPIGFAVSVFILAFENGRVATMLEKPIPQSLGKISYSMYLNHFVILQVMSGFLRVLDSKFGGTIYDSIGGVSMINFSLKPMNDLLALVYVSVVIGVSIWTYNYVEAPFRDLFNSYADKLKLSRKKELS